MMMTNAWHFGKKKKQTDRDYGELVSGKVNLAAFTQNHMDVAETGAVTPPSEENKKPTCYNTTAS